MLHRSSQPFNHLFLPSLNRLQPFPYRILVSTLLITKALKDSHNLSTFHDLIFFHGTKIWKDNRLLLTYIWFMFHLRRDHVTDLNWPGAWKIPVESDVFSKDVSHWSVYILKTLLFRRCFSKNLIAQIKLSPPRTS